MRSLGLGLITLGSLATIGAMFLPVWDIPIAGEDPQNWWEGFNGLDIALAVACVISACLSTIARMSRRGVVERLAGIAGALAFGLAFAIIPDTIHDAEYADVGLWVAAGTGAIAFVGAVLVAVAGPD
jgi:hypothetical protein